jgi:hypothetical protein
VDRSCARPSGLNAGLCALKHDEVKTNHGVMPGLSRSKNGVASLAYVPGIHVLAAFATLKDVDGRDKPGHDGREPIRSNLIPL